MTAVSPGGPYEGAPMIVVPFDDETVAIVEQALSNPERLLVEPEVASLTGNPPWGTTYNSTARAVVVALRFHSYGLALINEDGHPT